LNEFAQQLAVDPKKNLMYILGHSYLQRELSFFAHKTPIFLGINTVTRSNFKIRDQELMINDLIPNSFAFPLLDLNKQTLYCAGVIHGRGIILMAYDVMDENPESNCNPTETITYYISNNKSSNTVTILSLGILDALLIGGVVIYLVRRNRALGKIRLPEALPVKEPLSVQAEENFRANTRQSVSLSS
jgi:hypothetical protein